jgi:hypothetical protein
MRSGALGPSSNKLAPCKRFAVSGIDGPDVQASQSVDTGGRCGQIVDPGELGLEEVVDQIAAEQIAIAEQHADRAFRMPGKMKDLRVETPSR